MSEHTPLPWILYAPVKDSYSLRIFAKDFVFVGEIGNTDEPLERTKANAEFIVRAVNAHDELVAALELLLRQMDRGAKPRKLDEALTWRENDFIARATAEKALAAAKGKIP